MKALIAEDDGHMRRALSEILEGEGFEVTAVSNGTEAWATFESERPDIVLLDVMMPGISGYEVCRKIRDQDTETPALFVSAKSEEIDTVVGLELGADDYIVKPFGFQEVLARVRAALRRSGKRRASWIGETFEMGDLQVRPDALRAYRGSESLELSPRDVRVLRTLYHRRGCVVDRETLFNECWGLDHMPQSRTLDQHISQLRKRIERDPSRPEIIRTVHGVGYRYEG